MVKNQASALALAEAMERRAVRVYGLAIRVTEDAAIRAALQAVLREEEGHLRRFSAMLEACGGTPADVLLLQTRAAEILLPGGVTELAREEALSSPEKLFGTLCRDEEDAEATYLSLAEKCDDEAAKAAFTAIAAEERSHLLRWQEMLHAAHRQVTGGK